MKTSILLGTAMLLCLASCKNTNKLAKESINKKAVETKFDPSGYQKGVIVHSEEKGDCEYTILLDNGTNYDPINLENSFKKGGMSVYFKYRGLRMANRCTKANPISIEEILEAQK